VGARFLDDEARAAFEHAVETIEAASAVEVVVAVRRRSDRYLHANVIVGVAVAFAGLAAMLFSSAEFGLTSILFDPFIVGGIAGATVELLPAVKRLLTPAAIRRHRVTLAARAAFVERGVHNTIGRSGVLVYISWLEQQVALVADSGLDGAFTAEALREAEIALTAEVRSGGAAVARNLAQLATKLGAAMPRSATDVNELPDAIDSDLDRRGNRR
jgi:putative membrane protein